MERKQRNEMRMEGNTERRLAQQRSVRESLCIRGGPGSSLVGNDHDLSHCDVSPCRRIAHGGKKPEEHRKMLCGYVGTSDRTANTKKDCQWCYPTGSPSTFYS